LEVFLTRSTKTLPVSGLQIPYQAKPAQHVLFV
jgi:hypothetical protein